MNLKNIDWQMLTLNIRQKMPLARASKKLGYDNDYLARFARNEVDEPRFSKGVLMLDMHLELCGIEKHRKLLTNVKQ